MPNVLHSQATGIHPGAIVSADTPDATHLQTNTLWVQLFENQPAQLWRLYRYLDGGETVAAWALVGFSTQYQPPIENPVCMATVEPEEASALDLLGNDPSLKQVPLVHLWIDGIPGELDPPYRVRVSGDRGATYYDLAANPYLDGQQQGSIICFKDGKWVAETDVLDWTNLDGGMLVVAKDHATQTVRWAQYPGQLVQAAYDGPVPAPSAAAGATERCGVAEEMLSVLQHLYNIAQQVFTYVLTEFLDWQDHLEAVAGVIVGGLKVAEFARWIVTTADVLLPVILDILGVLVTAVLADEFGSLTTEESDATQKACYCALDNSLGTITVTQATLNAWQANIGAAAGLYEGATAHILGALIGLRSVDAWQNDATVGAANPSSGCADYVCG